MPHGDLRIKNYLSAVTRSWRQLYIYTPPRYDENTLKKYPVLYILHGDGEDERGWATQGKDDLILDNLIAQGKAKPMLIVMPDANIGAGVFNVNSIESALKMFKNEMKQSILPFIEKKIRAKTNANSRAFSGLSLGRLHTLYTGISNTGLFAYMGVFSSGWIILMMNKLADAQYDFIKANTDKINNNLKVLWISQSGKDDMADNNGRIMLGRLDGLKIKYTYSEYFGGHIWPVWRNNRYNFSQLLFKQAPNRL